MDRTDKINYDFSVLEDFLNSHEIPSVKQQPKTFLEIARQPHYENVISNIYAFYFDPHEEHGLGHLFINSFIECIQEQLKKDFLNDFQEFVIETEYGTEDKGRIDLFLYNDEQAIIIENKIYHHLANNLDDYWNTARTENRKDNMVGVLLTLGKHSGNLHPQFVNVLHLEFLQKVMANIGNHLMEASDKYVTFLKDLYQNIENMSTKNISEKDYKFYIKYQEKIIKTVSFNDQLKEYIKTQVVDAWNNQEGLTVQPATWNTKKYYWYREIYKEGIKDLFFSVEFDGLLNTDRTVWFSINVKDNGPFKDIYRNTEIVSVMEEYPKLNYKKSEQIEGGWIYLAGNSYEMTDENMANLQTTLENIIKDDRYMEVFNKLHDKLVELEKDEL